MTLWRSCGATMISALRNGYSAFRYRQTAHGDLPIHFFTIVLNGEPFIRCHERVFSQLPVRWHWHVVEGVAALKHDTAWSVAGGGHVSDAIHTGGRSNDGTHEYLDDLARRFPDQVTIYRKPFGEFWDGKLEMVNAPLTNIREACLLWQVDSDELWTTQQIAAVHNSFRSNSEKTAAYYWCWYFVGPNKLISTRYNYAQNPRQEWLRTWRFELADRWAAHEPPTLTRYAKNGVRVNIGELNPFRHDEMEAVGAVFQHFAYVTEAQLRFKETYYGYADAVIHWNKLQRHGGAGLLRDYLPWVADNTMFDDASVLNVRPIAEHDGESGSWSFSLASDHINDAMRLRTVKPRIVIDGIFFQYLATGISRVWTCLLDEWSRSAFKDHVIVLDRSGSAPRIAGIHYRTIRAHDYNETAQDSLYLEQICRELAADVFVSTYYSTPTDTPSVFIGYDMIPEVMGFDLKAEAWKEKRRAIGHACAHIMISENSARDLERIMPVVPKCSTVVAHCGVASIFRPSDKQEVDEFKRRFGLLKPYVLIVGDRVSYKNAFLLFRSISLLPDPTQFALVCVGGHDEIEPGLRALVPATDVRRLKFDDRELRAAYSGAHAYVCTSRYEGFGMPILEAMACECPVVACRNSSIPEVAGEAALFVGEDDATGLAEALLLLTDQKLRGVYVKRGISQASRFSFPKMAEEVAGALLSAVEGLKSGRRKMPGPAWDELRRLQQVEKDADALRMRLSAIEASAIWRATNPLRTIITQMPMPIRRRLRQMAKAAYWMITPHKIPARVAFIRERNRIRRESSAALFGQSAPRGSGTPAAGTDGAIWWATKSVRAVATRIPAPIRRRLRQMAKAAYWMITPHKIPARIAFIRQRKRIQRQSPAALVGQSLPRCRGTPAAATDGTS
jgi:glycosyltransferase involved in cell wall biosynthesis